MNPKVIFQSRDPLGNEVEVTVGGKAAAITVTSASDGSMNSVVISFEELVRLSDEIDLHEIDLHEVA